MNFYLLKDEQVSFFGLLNQMFVSSVVIKPNYERLSGSSSAADYQKIWNIVSEMSRMQHKRSNYFLVQMEYLTSQSFSRKHHGPNNGEHMVQVGIHGSLLTQALVEMFGENEVCLELSISHLRQEQDVYSRHIISPQMPVGPSNGENKFACTAMGPTSWFADIEDSVIPKADMKLRVIVSARGMENFRAFQIPTQQLR